MNYKTILAFFVCLLALSATLFSQVRIKELPGNQSWIQNENLLIPESGSTRKITELSDSWEVYLPGNKEERTRITVPSSFSGEDEIVMEKHLKFSQDQIQSHNFRLLFLGINHAAEISLNGYIIYKHTGGEYPFHVDLPKDLLKFKRSNSITVKIIHRYDSELTMPLKQRFLFAGENGGIIRNVFLVQLPATYISDMDFSYVLNNKTRAILSVKAGIGKLVSNNFKSDSSETNKYFFRIRLISPGGTDVLSSGQDNNTTIPAREKGFSRSLTVSDPVLWNPWFPQSYKLSVQLYRGDMLIDEVAQPVSFCSLQPGNNELRFNGLPFQMNGVTYMQSYYDYGNLLSYSRMREDIRLIKELGFNCVRFAKAAPHPYLLELCREYGLIAFIELPLGSVPPRIADKPGFIARSKNYLAGFLKAYKPYTAVLAMGLGSSYFSDNSAHLNLLQDLAAYVKSNSKLLTYASFSGSKFNSIGNIDLYGIEFLNKSISEYTDKYSAIESSLGKGRVFISEATYSTFAGNSNGYLNNFSYEAQAKFFSDLMDFTWTNKTPGYFINSMFDYRGAFASLSMGYSSDNLYHIGILGEDRQTNRPSYKLIYSRLHDTEHITIPIGNKKDDSPISFILIGVVLAILIALFINAKKKFREDAMRALMRPYNFFADIRDQRLMSGFHSYFLMLILSICSSLLLVNILYYYRSNVILENALISLGSTKIVGIISFLAWNPTWALLWLTLFSAVLFSLVSMIIKTASLFIKNKVHLSSIFVAVVWAFLPLILLLPLGLILYKILSAGIFTVYILYGLIAFFIWIFYRLMKSIYVILDVNPAQVYFYSTGFILFVLLAVILYFHLSDSSAYYLLNTFNQYM